MNNRFTNGQLWQLILAHVRDIVREPAVLFWGIIFPILMSLGLGVAFTSKKDVIHDLALVGTVSPALDSLFREHAVEKGKGSEGDVMLTMPNPKIGNTTFRFRPMDWTRAMVLLKRGQLNVIITDSAGNIRYHFDPLNPDGQLTYMKLSNLVENHDLLNPDSQDNIKPLTVKGTRYIDFLIPGLIALGVITSCMWGISYTIIERRAT